MAEYKIPHNYKNNGRLFNLFERAAVKKALIWTAPTTALVFIIPISFTMKCFWWTLAVLPLVLLFLLEFDMLLFDMIMFQTKRNQIYYDGERPVGGYAYEKNKKAGNASRKND